MKAGEPNTRIKRSLFSMFKEYELPQYPLEKRRRNLNKWTHADGKLPQAINHRWLCFIYRLEVLS